MENNTQQQVRKEPLIGKFKPKRKFLNFVSVVNGARIRFIRDIAFVKGEKLSGTLEGAIFKITICDEDTINFEEQSGTQYSDDKMIQRLIDEICEREVGGYAQKSIVSGVEFSDIDGKLCYLEVEYQKPIDKLKSIFDEDVKVEVSDKSLSLLDDLFSDSEFEEDDALSDMVEDLSEDDDIQEVENPAEPNQKLKVAAESYMEQQFRKMNESKIIELEYRIEETQKEIIRLKSDSEMAIKKIEEKSEQLGVLETRLESLKPGEESNGYVFFISEEKKDLDSLDEKETEIALKISKIMKLKGEVLLEMLTCGYYEIKIAKKDDIENQDFELEKEIYQKILSIDILGKITLTSDTFQYRGELTWHQLVGKMIKLGFEQSEDFDKLCQSNSYGNLQQEKSE